MKYIRTKDEILESNGLIQSNLTIEENAILVCGGHFAIPMSLIIKQADTIEELCDEFVCDNKIVVCDYDFAGNLWINDKLFEDIKDIVYGAIWTKGEHDEPILKSVVKMKGVLPNGEVDWELL